MMAATNDAKKDPALETRDEESPAGRVAKRPRRDDTGGSCSGLVLPPEVWAGIIEYLPFASILSCAATSRSMLHDTLPRLTSLSIDNSSEMNLEVACRFRDIEVICINSLLRVEVEEAGTPHEWRNVSVDLETSNRVVPFLSYFRGKKLQQVSFGCKDEATGNRLDNIAAAREEFFDGDDAYPYDGSREKMLQFIDSISFGFRCGALPKHLKISGLCCPDTMNQRGFGYCAVCTRACKSFPVEEVVGFHCRGSSASNALSGRSYGLDVCLDRAQIETIVRNRPQGSELLFSEERLLRLLGSARRYKIVVDGGEALYIVKYRQAELDEIKRQVDALDMKEIPTYSRKVSDAIMKSFANDKGYMPPMDLRYISADSLDCLKNVVGLRFDREELERPLAAMAGHARQVASVLIDDGGQDYGDIERDCLRLTRRFVEEIEANPPIDEIADSIPSLAKYLDYGDEFQDEAVRCLQSILAKGTDEHRSKVMEANAIPSFSRLLSSSKKNVCEASISALRIIVEGGEKERIQEVAVSGAIAGCIDLLDSKRGAGAVKDSLTVLVATKDHIKITSDLLLPHIFRMIKSSNQLDVLPDCMTLLRHVLKVDHRAIQMIIDSAVIVKLVEMMSTTYQRDIRTSLAHVLVDLTSGSDKQTADVVKEAGYLSVLIDLQDSSCDTISERATLSLHKIAGSGVTETWTPWKSNKSLSWGEFEVSGELVDSDEESEVSFEEAEEVSDEQVQLEEEHALASSNVMTSEVASLVFDVPGENTLESPTLLGIPTGLIEKILHFATGKSSEVISLEQVCRRFRRIARRDDFWTSHPAFSSLWVLHPSHPKTRKFLLEMRALRQIRKFQKSSDQSEIIAVLSDGSGDADAFRAFSVDLLSRMIHSQSRLVHFRLRGDTIWYITELTEGWMVKKLEHALLAAVHCHRTEVQKEDVSLAFNSIQHGNLDRSHSIPSASGTTWRCPEEDDCCDVLPPEAGRRIIRRLAYRAGIREMSSGAFALAETELLHAMGTLLVDGYEASFEMAKTASYLNTGDEVGYRVPANSMLPHNDDSTSDLPPVEPMLDMWKVPPHPFRVPPGDDNANPYPIPADGSNESTHTIVPGQIAAAAEQRNISPSTIYGCGWIVSSWFTMEEEHEIERDYYYRTFDEASSGAEESVSAEHEKA